MVKDGVESSRQDQDGGDWFGSLDVPSRLAAIYVAQGRNEKRIGELERKEFEKDIALKIYREEKQVAEQFEKCLFEYCERRRLNSDFEEAATKSVENLEVSMADCLPELIKEKKSCLEQGLNSFKRRVEKRQDRIEMETEIHAELRRIRKIFDQTTYFYQPSAVADVDKLGRESMRHLEEKMTRKTMPLEEMDRNRKIFAEELDGIREGASEKVLQQHSQILGGLGHVFGYTGIGPLYSTMSNYLWPKDQAAPVGSPSDQPKRESTWDLLWSGSRDFGKAAHNIWSDWRPWK